MSDYTNKVLALIGRNPEMFEGLNPDHRVAFMRWIPANEHVIKAFGRYALTLKLKGNREYYSAYAIRERLRWDSMISEVGTEYKLSNNNTPFLARLIMKMDHRLANMFVTHSGG